MSHGPRALPWAAASCRSRSWRRCAGRPAASSRSRPCRSGSASGWPAASAVEGALVTCGAASGVQQAAAACLTGTDAERVQRLPFTDGWRNRFVIPQVDAHDYLFQVIASAGGVLVKVGSKKSCPTAAIADALDDDTAAVLHYLGKQTLGQLAEVVAVAYPRGIPVIVDAAAQLPPRSNLTEPVRLGAGLVVFSGGKGLRSPQSSGLVVGKAELIQAATRHAAQRTSAPKYGYPAAARGLSWAQLPQSNLLLARRLAKCRLPSASRYGSGRFSIPHHEPAFTTKTHTTHPAPDS